MDSLTNTINSILPFRKANAKTNADLPPTLTFGVEFEFALAVLFKGGTDHDPDPFLPPALILPAGDDGITYTKYELDNIAHETVAHALEQAGLPAQGHKPSIDYVRVPSPWSDEVETVPYTPYGASWVVTGDSTIRGPDERYRWTQAELQSPPYMYSPAALNAVKLACSVLTTKFKCNVNASTGMHVHVGNGAEGFPFEVIRNLMLFLWTFEPQMDQLHARERVDGEWFPSLRGQSNLTFENRKEEARPLSGEELCFGGEKKLKLDPDVMEEEQQESDWDTTQIGTPPHERETVMRGISVVEGIQKIWNVASITSLHKLLRCWTGRKSKYNLFFLTNENIHPTQLTVEFRQHAGTLDGDLTVAWIRTVVGIMEFARAHASAQRTHELVSFCLQHARKEDAGAEVADVVDLLKAIGLVEEARFWSERLPDRRMPTKYDGLVPQTGH